MRRLLRGKKRDEFGVAAVCLFLFWMVISLHDGIWSKLGLINLFEHSIVGLIISLLIVSLYPECIFSSRQISKHRDLGTLFRLVMYGNRLMIDIFLAGIDVARRVLRRQLMISPGIVQVETPLHTDGEITLNANSITLTPGTITIEAEKTDKGSIFWVHCISQEAVKGILESGGFVEKIRSIYRRKQR
ncbi:MAG: Na+/H+ antiporter subunit E [bacterium]